MRILGISAFYHDSAAALVDDGVIVAAAQEERFTRKKHDHRFPSAATRYCLHEGGVGADGLDAVVFYDKPITKFFRILKTCFRTRNMQHQHRTDGAEEQMVPKLISHQ